MEPITLWFYVEGLTSVIGHADRAVPLRDYCAGLLVTEGRMSVEPMAAATARCGTSVHHQKLLHFVGEGAGLAGSRRLRPFG